MITITKTVDDHTLQTFELPAPVTGTVLVRVVDTDRTRGDTVLDTIRVDAMSFSLS